MEGERERGNVINFNAVSINHSDTNTHKRRTGAEVEKRNRGIGGGLKEAHLGSRWQQPRIGRTLQERACAGTRILTSMGQPKILVFSHFVPGDGIKRDPDMD